MAFMCPPLSRFPYNVYASLIASPATASILKPNIFLQPKHLPEKQIHTQAKTRSRKLSEQQRNYHGSMQRAASPGFQRGGSLEGTVVGEISEASHSHKMGGAITKSTTANPSHWARHCLTSGERESVYSTNAEHEVTGVGGAV